MGKIKKVKQLSESLIIKIFSEAILISNTIDIVTNNKMREESILTFNFKDNQI